MTSDDIKLIPVDVLRHIEEFSEKRVKRLMKKIEADGIWITPLCVEASSHAVMDGQHRMDVAKRLNLKHVPALLLTYNDSGISIRTGRLQDFNVTADDVISRALSGNIYPYKTAKHTFPFKIPKCNIKLEDLR